MKLKQEVVSPERTEAAVRAWDRLKPHPGVIVGLTVGIVLWFIAGFNYLLGN